MGNNNPRIPHVRICQKCGLHGHFTIPANDYSLDFCSIDQGMAFLDQEIANRNLIGYNISVLRRQIMSCGLPAEHTSVPEELLWKIEQWNDDHQACRNDKIFLQYHAHAFTEHPDFIIEIPEDFREHLNNRLNTTQTVEPTM